MRAKNECVALSIYNCPWVNSIKLAMSVKPWHIAIENTSDSSSKCGKNRYTFSIKQGKYEQTPSKPDFVPEKILSNNHVMFA